MASNVDLALIIRAQDQATAVLKSIQGQLGQLHTQTQANHQGMGQLAGSFAIGTVAAHAFMGAVQAIGGVMVGAAQSTLTMSNRLEQAHIALKTMLGSAEAATTFIGQLQDYAENTAFDFPGIQDTAQHLMAMGVEAANVIPLVTDMSNALSAAGKGGNVESLQRVSASLAEIQAQGKLSGEQIRELSRNGIAVIPMLSQALGVSAAKVRELSEAGAISAEKFFKIFHDYTVANFGNIQAEQAKTWAVAASNLGDILNRLSVTALAPLFQALTSGVNILNEFLKTDRVKQFAADFAASMSAALQALKPLTDMMGRALGMGGTSAAAAATTSAASSPGPAAAVAATADKMKELDAAAREATLAIHRIGEELQDLNVQSTALKQHIEDVKDGFEATLKPLHEQQAALTRLAEDTKTGYAAFLDPLKASLDSTKRQIDDIKSGYDRQIDAIRQQIDAVEGVNDKLRAQQDIQAAIEDAELRMKGLTALGDPGIRADLQNKLDSIGFDRSRIANQIQLLQLKNRDGENDKKIKALQMEANKLDAEAIKVREKIAGLVDRKALAEVKTAQAMQEQLKAQQAIERAKENLARQELLDPLKEALKNAEAAKKAAVEPLEAQAEALQRMYDSIKAQQDEALGKIEAQQAGVARAIQDTEAAQKAVLLPLEEQAKILDRQIAAVRQQQQEWETAKTRIADAKAEAEALKKAAKEAAEAIKEVGTKPMVPADAADRRAAGKKPMEGHSFLPQIDVAGWMASIQEDLGGAIERLLQFITDHTVDFMDALEKWGTEFGAWLKPIIPKLPGILGDVIIAVNTWILKQGPAIVERLGKWAAAFIDWVGPIIPPLIVECEKLLLRLAVWTYTVALPMIVEKLKDWGIAFVKWLAPHIPDLLLEFAKFELAVAAWIIGDAKTKMTYSVTKFWPNVFLNWVDIVVNKIPDEMNRIRDAQIQWVKDTFSADSGIVGWFKWIGHMTLWGLAEGIKFGLPDLHDWLKKNFVDKLPEWVRDWLGIKSPSTVFATIGEQIVAGLIKGIARKFPDLMGIIGKLTGMFGGAGGDISGDAEDWLKSAMSITGVDGDWFKGLKKLMGLESGGDPNARNPEAVNGEHASGLMQMLPSTFHSFNLKGMNDIWNPIHNAASAIRYIMETYGSVYNIRGIGREGEFKGYASGGIVGGALGSAQSAIVHGGEVVLNRAQQQRLLSGNAGGGRTEIHVHVAGSVTSEGDLVECIRRGLLKTARRNGLSALGGYA